jgi:hypothetical protein
MMKRIAFTALLVFAAALPATAQVHFGITGGWYTPYSSTKDFAKTGYDGGILLGFGAPVVPVSFRVDGNYAEMPGQSISCCGGTVKSDFTIYSATGNIVWTIFGSTLPTKLYLIGGVGYYSVQQKVSVGGGAPAVPASTTSAFGYNGGVGFRFTMFFIEARYTSITNGLDESTFGGSGSKALTVIPINVGVMF